MFADKALVSALEKTSIPNPSFKKGTYLLSTYGGSYTFWIYKVVRVGIGSDMMVVARRVATNARWTDDGEIRILMSKAKMFRRLPKSIIATLSL